MSIHDRNGNITVDVTLSHLAAPQALVPPWQYYVVWIQPRGQQPEVVGRLRVNTSDMAGSIQTLTPYNYFEIFVTAENSELPESPSSTVILKGTVQKK